MNTETIETAAITPPLKWQGGKRRVAKRLLPMIAARPHECWVEAFAGGAAMTFLKPRSKLEVINDTNHHLVNFYRYASPLRASSVLPADHLL